VYSSYWDCLCFPSLQTKYDKTLPNPSGEFGAVSAYLHEHYQHKSIINRSSIMSQHNQPNPNHWTSLNIIEHHSPACSHIFSYFPHSVAVIPLILQPHPSWYHRSDPRKSGLATARDVSAALSPGPCRDDFGLHGFTKKWITCENDQESREKHGPIMTYLSI
jgi:hypothetical protein